jgi:hypothetical protein
MRQERAANHSSAFCAEVKKNRSYTSSPPVCHVGTIQDTFNFFENETRFFFIWGRISIFKYNLN